MEELKNKIREVPDFPKQGIRFYDITTLISDPDGLRSAVDLLTDRYRDQEIDKVIAIESRGFIFGSTLAYNLGVGFVPVRKPGKLPAQRISATYDLEYGQDSVEVHSDAVESGQRVLIVDDVIATGGTAAATVELVQRLGGVIVELAFVVELGFLKGRDRLEGVDVFSILTY